MYLPGEIWDKILSYLFQVQTIGRLLCTNRVLRDITYSYASHFEQRDNVSRYIPGWWLIRFPNTRVVDRVMCLSLEEVHAVACMSLFDARIRMPECYVHYFLIRHVPIHGSYVEINGSIGWNQPQRCIFLTSQDHVSLLPDYPTIECRCRHVPQVYLPCLRSIRFLVPMRFPTRDYSIYAETYNQLFSLINMNPTITHVEQVGIETTTWYEPIVVQNINMLVENRSMRSFHLGVSVEDMVYLDRIYPNLQEFTVMYTGTLCIPLIFRLIRDRKVYLLHYPEDIPPSVLERYLTLVMYS